MAYGLSNDGEVALLDYYFANKTVVMGLYNDADDNLADDDGPTNATEPSGNYQRQDVPPSEVTVELNPSSNGEVTISPQTFSVGQSSMNVDSWFVYNATDDDMIGRGGIDTSGRQTDYVNLDQVESFRLGGQSFTLD